MRRFWLVPSLALAFAAAACGGEAQDTQVEEAPAAETPAQAPAAPMDSAAAAGTDSAAAAAPQQ